MQVLTLFHNFPASQRFFFFFTKYCHEIQSFLSTLSFMWLKVVNTLCIPNNPLNNNKTIELIFMVINMFWAWFRLFLAWAVRQGLKWALRRAYNIFMPKNINCIIIYIRPISCNKPVKYNSIFHRVKYKADRILFGRFITWNSPYIYITNKLHHRKCFVRILFTRHKP